MMMSSTILRNRRLRLNPITSYLHVSSLNWAVVWVAGYSVATVVLQ